jgi:hypothetical protein
MARPNPRQPVTVKDYGGEYRAKSQHADNRPLQGPFANRSVRKALADGVRHYSLSGRLLTTGKQILEALVADGQIRLEGTLEVLKRCDAVFAIPGWHGPQ